jgi:hypothetical protein
MRVQPSIAYDPDTDELTVRAWVEDSLRLVVEDTLVLSLCSAELVDQDGVLVSSVVGAVDAVGDYVSKFVLAGVTPALGDHYLLILALRSAVETHGPRTVGIPVN